MSADPIALREAARDAVRAGRQALVPYECRASGLDVREKAARDFVTAADLASEAAIGRVIRERFPDHEILGEEGLSAAARGSAPVWIVDPLDGTANFIHGYPVYSVSVACSLGTELLAAAVLDITRNEMFLAARGQGASLNGTPIAVSSRGGLRHALIATGFPFRRLHRLVEFTASLGAVLNVAEGVRRAGSAAIDLAYVACGRVDGFWEEGLGPWDIAAGALLIEEAGGVVTDFGGGGDYLETGAVVAANRAVHPELRALVFAHQEDGTG